MKAKQEYFVTCYIFDTNSQSGMDTQNLFEHDISLEAIASAISTKLLANNNENIPDTKVLFKISYRLQSSIILADNEACYCIKVALDPSQFQVTGSGRQPKIQLLGEIDPNEIQGIFRITENYQGGLGEDEGIEILYGDTSFNESRITASMTQSSFFYTKEEKREAPGVSQEANFEPEAFNCPITYEQMEEPVFCTLDNLTYEKSAIEQWLAKNGSSPMTREPIPVGITAAELLYPNNAAKAGTSFHLCPITGEKMLEPTFCNLDGVTYEKAAIEDWLKDNPFSPVDNTPIPYGKSAQDVLYPNLTIRSAIEELDNKQMKAPNV